jgi:hypothetical protein
MKLRGRILKREEESKKPDLELGEGIGTFEHVLSASLLQKGDDDREEKKKPELLQPDSNGFWPCLLVGLAIAFCVIIPLLIFVVFALVCDADDCIYDWLKNQSYDSVTTDAPSLAVD